VPALREKRGKNYSPPITAPLANLRTQKKLCRKTVGGGIVFDDVGGGERHRAGACRGRKKKKKRVARGCRRLTKRAPGEVRVKNCARSFDCVKKRGRNGKGERAPTQPLSRMAPAESARNERKEGWSKKVSGGGWVAGERRNARTEGSLRELFR